MLRPMRLALLCALASACAAPVVPSRRVVVIPGEDSPSDEQCLHHCAQFGRPGQMVRCEGARLDVMKNQFLVEHIATVCILVTPVSSSTGGATP